MATFAAGLSCCATVLPVRARGFSGFSAPAPSLHRATQAAPGVCRMKKGIHPEFHEAAPVVCNGEEVFVTGGAKSEYQVEVWSGNHPFWSGSDAVRQDDTTVASFKARYADFDEANDMSNANEGAVADIAAWKKKMGMSRKDKKGKKRRG
mmetsp:Transcript_2980/g.8735  ORF Transcript_2980/g.8735 Transcript_2980/m.8735 type:complete len:150 (-) Transcript_2980:426-875(-)|eukprot:CAMPEP_0206147198 /NCGR_PEP_ID=MMETSP1473-20131121/32736_1 /ASSEMBLY_ACC=CAM_ASM_001109 /TAXON_ID=1461547 /ORGANISM="Stichococcus sp, Strain RCC1054" /LENGTH=149 /DNA_ID=CAMNT_0053544043 /DNA_START=144 /DNA_END=593 /DNA_ORIENTATION=-